MIEAASVFLGGAHRGLLVGRREHDLPAF